MRVLGVDLGLVRSGLAISDEQGLTVRMLGNLQARSQKEAVDKIMVLVRLHEVAVVVIGKPHALSPQSSAIARRALSLAQALKEREEFREVDVVLWDESLSSKKGMQNLLESGVPRKKRRELLDAAAAAVLVEEYLSLRTRAV